MKSDSATVRVPELEFEIPVDTQRGSITTVEGLLRDAADALRALQPERLAADPAQARPRQRAHALHPVVPIKYKPFVCRLPHPCTCRAALRLPVMQP